MRSNYMIYYNLGVLLVLATVEGRKNVSTSSAIVNTTSGWHTEDSLSSLRPMYGSMNTTSMPSSTKCRSCINKTDISTTQKVNADTSATKNVNEDQRSVTENTTSQASSSTTDTSTPPAAKYESNIFTGIIIILFLLFLIIVLTMIIYRIRRKTKHYSYDLKDRGQEDADMPLSTVGPEGVFVPTKAEEKPADFGSADKAADEISSAPVGGPLQSEPNKSASEDDMEKSENEDSFGSQDPLTPNNKPLDFNFDLIIGEPSHSSNTSTESLGEQLNESNNNNITGNNRTARELAPVVPSETFTEISLDEPV